MKYELGSVEDFLKEIGTEPLKDSKLTVTPATLPEAMQVVLLERKSG